MIIIGVVVLALLGGGGYMYMGKSKAAAASSTTGKTKVKAKPKATPKPGAVITIDPITRLEGHGKIVIRLDDDGEVVSGEAV